MHRYYVHVPKCKASYWHINQNDDSLQQYIPQHNDLDVKKQQLVPIPTGIVQFYNKNTVC